MSYVHQCPSKPMFTIMLFPVLYWSPTTCSSIIYLLTLLPPPLPQDSCVVTSGLNYTLPFLMPEFRDKFVVALTKSRLLVGSDEPATVQEELRERRTEEEGRRKDHFS